MTTLDTRAAFCNANGVENGFEEHVRAGMELIGWEVPADSRPRRFHPAVPEKDLKTWRNLWGGGTTVTLGCAAYALIQSVPFDGASLFTALLYGSIVVLGGGAAYGGLLFQARRDTLPKNASLSPVWLSTTGGLFGDVARPWRHPDCELLEVQVDEHIVFSFRVKEGRRHLEHLEIPIPTPLRAHVREVAETIRGLASPHRVSPPNHLPRR